ncbi:MAG: PIG-L deacetylase family protein [bacterium]|nr:PIG-L deacetylase family protein [bacterium]
MKILVFSPHHDDETIGCGGSICLHTSKGDEVAVAFIFAGWSAVPDVTNKKEAALIIQNEAREACEDLGVSNIIELFFGDRACYPSEDATGSLVKVLRDIGPEIVYIPHPNDGDREHRFVSEISIEALWMSSSDYFPDLGKKIDAVRVVLGYEVWKPLQSYQYFKDISDVISIKKSALEKYKSQLKVKDWVRASLGLNAYRGVIAGNCSYAEVFQVIKIDKLP